MIAIIAAGIGAWAAYRFYGGRRAASASLPETAQHPGPEGAGSPGLELGGSRIELANSLVTERLWRLAFSATSQAQFLEPAQSQIRDSVTAILQADTLDPRYFPRRPTLMPQLMRAMDDPRAATDKLARIVAHDPVLAVDVLRLANSALYRTSPAPIETIQRAIVILGADALRGLVATAMLQPVFRATRTNFPRFPRMLWERTERAARAAEMYALKTHPEDRFEAQLVVLLSALGPLSVYGAALDVYARAPGIAPSPALCVALTTALGPPAALRMARHWESSPRLLAAIEKSPQESLAIALCAGELLGTLSLLESQSVISQDEALATIRDAGLAAATVTPIWTQLTTSR
jgi:hypothetical protein